MTLKEKGKRMNELKIFENSKFGKVRAIERNGEPWFVATDVCKALAIDGTQTRRLDDDEKGVCSIQTLGGEQQATCVNEPGLYSLVLGSRKPDAKAFKRWITHDVIPSIRKTGVYVAPSVDSDMMFKIAEAMRDKERQIAFLETEAAKNKPLVQFAEHVSTAANAISVGDFAKLLNDENIPIGRTRLFRWFKENGYLQGDNVPYQRYIDAGYFDVIEQTFNTPYKKMVSVKTLITGKGQIYFTEKLRKAG